MNRIAALITTLIVLLTVGPAFATEPPADASPAEEAAPSPAPAADPFPVKPAPEAHHRWHLELAVFPMFTAQQIEGPERDDLLTEEGGLSTALTLGFAPIKYIEPMLWLQFDVGTTRRAIFTRPDEDGNTAEEQVVDGSFWALWVAFGLRGRLGPAFLEAGWAPLILRDDTVREDIPNVDGETDGLFQGSRAVAWLVGVGASIPAFDNFDVTLRIQWRIRYLVSRGGEDLADEEETGQQAIWPFMGAHFHW